MISLPFFRIKPTNPPTSAQVSLVHYIITFDNVILLYISYLVTSSFTFVTRCSLQRTPRLHHFLTAQLSQKIKIVLLILANGLAEEQKNVSRLKRLQQPLPLCL